MYRYDNIVRSNEKIDILSIQSGRSVEGGRFHHRSVWWCLAVGTIHRKSKREVFSPVNNAVNGGGLLL